MTVKWVETEPVRYIVIVVSMASPADPFSISKMPRYSRQPLKRKNGGSFSFLLLDDDGNYCSERPN